MADLPFGAPEPLNPKHTISSFDCGKQPLNEYLHRHALSSQGGGSARTFVVTRNQIVVVGYYSLAATSVQHQDAPERVRQGQPRHPIPAVLMARFALDLSVQRIGLGRALFRDAMLRALNITGEIGARAFVVDAKDDDALRFYSKVDMMVQPTDPNRLFLLFKDIRRILMD